MSLNDMVLILNRNWLAINIRSVRRALKSTIAGRAKIVDHHTWNTYDFWDWCELKPEASHGKIRTGRMEVRCPTIIVLNGNIKYPKQSVKLSRKNIAARDDHTCQYCRKILKLSEATVDHVIPRSRGGKNCWENVVCSCVACNSKKADKLPQEAGMSLLSKPYVPRWFEVQIKLQGNKVKDEWRKFLG